MAENKFTKRRFDDYNYFKKVDTFFVSNVRIFKISWSVFPAQVEYKNLFIPGDVFMYIWH